MTKARDLANAADVLDDVSATELSYVNGVTSAIQTQLNNKQAVVANVNDTEIGYLDGVTSAIQTQLDAKVAKSLVDAKGDLLVGSANDTVSRLAVASTAGYVLTVDSAEATGLKWAAASTPSFVGCVAFLENNQSVATGTVTAINLDGEIVDTDGFHSNTVNNTRITVPSGKGGKYYIYFTVGMSNDSNSSERSVYIRKNGSTIYYCIQGSPAVTWWQQTGSIVQDLVATDYIELFVNHGRGANISYYGDSSVTKATQLGLIYLGA